MADFVSVATKILAKEPKEDLKKFANEFDRLKAASLENRTRVLELLEKALRRNLSNDELQIIKGRIDILLENEKRIADRMSELKTHIVKRSNIIITHVVEPRKENGNKDYASKVKIDESNCEALKQVIDSFDGDVPKGFIREYWIGILGAGSQNNSEIEPPKNTFIYRIPFSGNFEVRETSEFGKLLAEGMLQVNQLGNLGQIRIQPKKFAKKIYDIEFHAKTGGLLKYDVSTEGFAAESLLTTAQGIVSKIQEETKEKTALEKMQEENQLLQARIDKIKKEKELEELQEGDE